MSCGYCKDCKWWDTIPRIAPFGICERPAQPASKIWTDSGEDAIMTMADFGCIQFEAK